MAARNQGSTREVFEDHLHKAKLGSIEDDIAQNYATGVVVLSGRGVHHGHGGVRELARLLSEELPDGTFEYHTRLAEGEMAFLEWSGYSDTATVEDGADSFIIRDGKIVRQTIHYTVKSRSQPRDTRREGDGQ